MHAALADDIFLAEPGPPEPGRGRWPLSPGPRPTLAQCLTLALLIHLLLVLVFGNTPGGSARPGEGVWGALNIRLSGSETGGPRATSVADPAYSGPEGTAAQQRWGGVVRAPEDLPRPRQDSGATPQGRGSARPVEADTVPAETTGATPTLELPPAAAVATVAPVDLPAPVPVAAPLAAPAPAPAPAPVPVPVPVPVPKPAPVLTAPPAPIPAPSPAAPPLPVPPVPPLAPVATPAPLPALPTPEPLLPRNLPTPIGPVPIPPLSGPLLQPTRVEPLPLPSFSTLPAPTLPSPMPAPTPAALPESLRPAPPAALAPPSAPLAPLAPLAPSAPAGPPASAAPLATAITPAGSTPSTASGPRSPAAAGAPDAGARLGQDVATPASLPASAARLNLDWVRPRGGAISAQGGSGLLQMLPHPLEAKSKLAEDIEKAVKADCRKAYASLGLLAVLPLAVDAVRDKGCRW